MRKWLKGHDAQALLPSDGFSQLKMKNMKLDTNVLGFVKVHAGFPAKKKIHIGIGFLT